MKIRNYADMCNNAAEPPDWRTRHEARLHPSKASRSLGRPNPRLRRGGQGTFVAEKYRPFVTTLSGEWRPDSDSDAGLGGGEGSAAFNEVTARGRTARASRPRVEIQLAGGYVACRLRIAEGSNIISRHQERFIGLLAEPAVV